MKTFTFKSIFEAGSKENPDAFDEYDDVVQYLGNMNDTIIGFLNGFGFSWDHAKAEVYIEGEPIFVLDQCDFLFKCIDEAYDGILDESTIWTDYFNLGGDDDVDYNSSYPSVVVDVLRGMLNL